MNTVAKQSYFKLNEVLINYFDVIESVDLIIKESGYKTSYVVEKLNMPPSTFHFKKKNHSFTPQELQRLVNIIDIDDDDPVYLAYEQKLIAESKEANGSETMTYEDFKKRNGF
jgi:hypothetical protein